MEGIPYCEYCQLDTWRETHTALAHTILLGRKNLPGIEFSPCLAEDNKTQIDKLKVLMGPWPLGKQFLLLGIAGTPRQEDSIEVIL